MGLFKAHSDEFSVIGGYSRGRGFEHFVSLMCLIPR